jgi:hypothetical protein
MFCTNPLTIFELLLPSLGFEGTTFDDTDFGIVGIFLGGFDEVVFVNLKELLSTSRMYSELRAVSFCVFKIKNIYNEKF